MVIEATKGVIPYKAKLVKYEDCNRLLHTCPVVDKAFAEWELTESLLKLSFAKICKRKSSRCLAVERMSIAAPPLLLVFSENPWS